jgi:hypothetical protein
MTLKEQYNKERRRIQQQIRRMKKRGYEIQENVLPKKPRRITRASVNRLKNVKPDIIYKKASFKMPNGQKIKGMERRKEERRASARKAAQTRQFNRIAAGIQAGAPDPKYEEGRLILEGIYNRIDSIDKQHQAAAAHLYNVLDREISQYGEEAVCRNIAEAPQDIKDLSEAALKYNPGDPRHEEAIRNLQNLITGEIPTMEEMLKLQDAIDKDDFVTYDGSEDDWLFD